MVTQVVNTDISGPGIRVDLVTIDNLWVSRTGLVVSTNYGTAVYGDGSGHTVHIEGAVSGYFGVNLGNDPTLDSGNSVVIASTGVVYGTGAGVIL